jgi:uncharacterized protein YgbK (DUF1537 family)
MIVVIADDLSGAAELAGVAWLHGLTAEVQTVFSPETNAEIVCVDTDTRSLRPEEAARKVRELALQIAAAKADWIFKKCDSVLRGHIIAEARAITSVFGQTKIVVVSANPSRQRVVRKGNYWVNGIPLHETKFAADPEHPRKTSAVAELLGGGSTGVLTPDTETGEDVKRHASMVDGQTLAVGGVDFFEALLRARVSSRSLRPSEGKVGDLGGDTLLVCGSAAAWTERRIQAAADGIPIFMRPYDTTTAVQRLGTKHQILIGIGDGRQTRGRSPTELVNELASVVAIILQETNATRVLCEGGATSAALMRTMGWTRLNVSATTAGGIGVLQPVGSGAPRLFVKPGSYPWPKAIWPGDVE